MDKSYSLSSSLLVQYILFYVYLYPYSRIKKGMISVEIARLRNFAVALDCNSASFFHEQDEDARQRAERISELIQSMTSQKQDAIMRIVKKLAGMILMGKEELPGMGQRTPDQANFCEPSGSFRFIRNPFERSGT
jgi:hypothetical protein